MNTTECIRARRSIRKYKPGVVVPQADIDLMLEAAMCAPSAMNRRPWSFIVVENTALRLKIATAHPHAGFLKDASLAIVVCGDPKVYSSNSFLPQDCAAATQTLMLQAAELGYGTCWSAIYPDVERCAVISSLLDIRDVTPFAVIGLGVAAETPDRRGFYDKSKVRYVR